MLDRNPMRPQPCLHFLAGGGATDELLERMEIDREVPESAISPGTDLVFHRMPFGELGEIMTDLRRVCPEVMRAVGVNEDSMVVISVMRIAADMVATLDHQGSLTELRGGSFSIGQPAETRSDDQVVECPRHERKS